MPACYQLNQSAEGLHLFTFVTGTGRVILTSPAYPSKEDALQAVEALRVHATQQQRYHRTFNRNGEPFFVLHNANREIVATSEQYRNWNSLDMAMTLVSRYAATAKVVELKLERITSTPVG